MEEFATFELEGVPAETLHEPLDIVNGSGCVGNIPQEHTRQQQGEVQNKMEDQRHPKDTPRVDMADYSGRSPYGGAFKRDTSACWFVGCRLVVTGDS